MKITREELQAIENHMSNIPQVAGMYTPVLVAWCRALLDEQDGAFTRGAEAMRDAAANALDMAGQGTLCDTRECEHWGRYVRALPIPEGP